MLKLNDKILLNIEKPARYTGGEVNSCIKDPGKVDVRFAMCFPDVYEIGMSNLGVQIIYNMLNQRDDTWCERVFSPWPDLHMIMKNEDIPLFALESQDEIRNFDFLGISLSYEMAYTNILQILDLAQIPFYSKDRGDDMPIVMAGGNCTYNPEPFADFFDLIYIGEGETSFNELIELYKDIKKSGGTKQSFLREAAKIPGIYVPAFYSVVYNDDNTIKSFDPIYEDIPKTVNKQTVMDFENDYYPEAPVIPYIQVAQDKATLEIQRGCIRGCRFCQAGMIMRPFRTKPLEDLKKHARFLIQNTGWEELSLSSLSSSDCPFLGELLDFILDEFKDKKVNVSLPSLRIDEFSLDVMSRIQDVKKSSLTFAPEAGTQRLRDVINKGLTMDDIRYGAEEAFKGGWNKVKLYFMLGLPTETEEDILGIPAIGEELAEIYYDTVPKEKRLGKVQITMSTSFFIPKPFTPLQWARMYKPEVYEDKAHMINDHIKGLLNKKSLRYNWHDSKTSIIEGLFAKGDRRCARLIETAYRKGCMFDSWTDYFDMDKWTESMNETGIDLDYYIYRENSLDEILPWDFIDIGVTKDFLRKEWMHAMEAKVTPNCKEGCSACGAGKLGGDICRRETGYSEQKSPYTDNMSLRIDDNKIITDNVNDGTNPDIDCQIISDDAVVRKNDNEKPAINDEGMRVRIRFTKEESVKFLGHLDILRTFQKFMNRAGVEMQYSEGFNPHQKMSFALPLGLGLTSSAEYVDAVIRSGQEPDVVRENLNNVSGTGFEILSVRQLKDNAVKSMAAVQAADFEVYTKDHVFTSEDIDRFLDQSEIPAEKKTKSGIKTVDIRPMIIDITASGDLLKLRLSAGSDNNLKPEILLIALYDFLGLEYNRMNVSIKRTELLCEKMVPLEEYQVV